MASRLNCSTISGRRSLRRRPSRKPDNALILRSALLRASRRMSPRSWFETALKQRLLTMREHEPRRLPSAESEVSSGFSLDHNRLWNTGSSRAMTAARRSPPYNSPEQRIEQQFHVQNDDDAGHDPRRGGDGTGDGKTAH